MALDLSSLKKAVVSLNNAVDLAKKTIHGPVDTVLEEVIRAGVIQNFEVYEVVVPFLLKANELLQNLEKKND